jgi:hypothetical protein
MQSPTDIGRQLLSLGARQQHAEIQGTQELVFADPASTRHDLLVHDGDLTGWPTEADKTQFGPELKGLPE